MEHAAAAAAAAEDDDDDGDDDDTVMIVCLSPLAMVDEGVDSAFRMMMMTMLSGVAQLI
jgi:hypothetical protein